MFQNFREDVLFDGSDVLGRGGVFKPTVWATVVFDNYGRLVSVTETSHWLFSPEIPDGAYGDDSSRTAHHI